MSTKAPLILCVASSAVLAWSAGHSAGAGAAPIAAAFETLDLHLEIDTSDLTAEVALEVEASENLSRLTVYDVAGMPVLGLFAEDARGMGVSEISLEAGGLPIQEVGLAYPEGTYVVEATTVSGAPLYGTTRLSHKVPSRFHVVYPEDGQGVPADEATIEWTRSYGAARYLIEVERDDIEFTLELVLPAEQTSFTVPASLLERGQTYEYSLVAQGDDDNETEVEGTFFVLE